MITGLIMLAIAVRLAAKWGATAALAEDGQRQAAARRASYDEGFLAGMDAQLDGTIVPEVPRGVG